MILCNIINSYNEATYLNTATLVSKFGGSPEDVSSWQWLKNIILVLFTTLNTLSWQRCYHKAVLFTHTCFAEYRSSPIWELGIAAAWSSHCHITDSALSCGSPVQNLGQCDPQGSGVLSDGRHSLELPETMSYLGSNISRKMWWLNSGFLCISSVPSVNCLPTIILTN
jgi:hypothetical protein